MESLQSNSEVGFHYVNHFLEHRSMPQYSYFHHSCYMHNGLWVSLDYCADVRNSFLIFNEAPLPNIDKDLLIRESRGDKVNGTK